jgi:hypothetical protein
MTLFAMAYVGTLPILLWFSGCSRSSESGALLLGDLASSLGPRVTSHYARSRDSLTCTATPCHCLAARALSCFLF